MTQDSAKAQAQTMIQKYAKRTEKWLSSLVGIGKKAEWTRAGFSEERQKECAVMFACPEKTFRGETLKKIAHEVSL